MADAYDFARGRVAANLRRMQTGTITLTRATRADPEEDTPWIPGDTTSEAVYTLDARVDGVIAEYVNDSTIKATNRMVIASPKARIDDDVVDIEPTTSDVLAIDGEVVAVEKIVAVPAAGPPAMFHMILKS